MNVSRGYEMRESENVPRVSECRGYEIRESENAPRANVSRGCEKRESENVPRANVNDFRYECLRRLLHIEQ